MKMKCLKSVNVIKNYEIIMMVMKKTKMIIVLYKFN